MTVVLAHLCCAHKDIVKPDDIWACPMPESSQQEIVEKSVRKVTVRMVQASGRVDEHLKPPGVNEVTSHPSGGVKAQAGMTAEPPGQQEAADDEADPVG